MTPAAWLALSVADPSSETRRSAVVQVAAAADGVAALAGTAAGVRDVAGVCAGVADPAVLPPGLTVRLPAAVRPGPQPASTAPASTVPAARRKHRFIVVVTAGAGRRLGVTSAFGPGPSPPASAMTTVSGPGAGGWPAGVPAGVRVTRVTSGPGADGAGAAIPAIPPAHIIPAAEVAAIGLRSAMR